MEKYSVLLFGKNKELIDEFFTYLSEELECLSASTKYEDLKNHLNYCRPDLLVYCVLDEGSEDMKQVVYLKGRLTELEIPLAVVGYKADCYNFLRYTSDMAKLVIERPLSITMVCGKIKKFLSERQTKFLQEQTEKLAEKRKEEKGDKLKLLKENMEELGKKRILVVDDDPMMLKVIKETLRENYEVATAVSGKVALKYLTNRTVDLILLDYEMPEESGPEVLQKLYENKHTKEIPVLFLTGVTEKEKIQKALVLKPRGYLLKPIDRNKLISVIRKQFEE